MEKVNMEDNKKWLYDALSNKGYDLGNYKDFDIHSSEPESQKWLYDSSVKAGLDVGSFDEFSSGMGFSALGENTKTQLPLAIGERPEQGELVAKYDLPVSNLTQRIGKAIDETDNWKEEKALDRQLMPKLSELDTYKIGGEKFDRDKLLAPVDNVAQSDNTAVSSLLEKEPVTNTQTENVKAEPKDITSTAKPYLGSYENIRDYYFSRFSLTEEGKQAQADIAETQKDFTDILFTKMKGSQEYKDIMSSTAAPGDKDTAVQALWEKEYQPVLDKQIRPFINEYSQKVLSRYAGPMNEDVHKLDKATVRNSWESISGRVTEYEAELDKRKGGWQNVGAPTFESNVARIQREANSKDLNEKQRQVDAAKSMVESSQKMIAAADAESGSNFFEGMGRGLADEAFNIDNWTMGLKGLADGQACLGVLEKCEKDGPDSLTKEEQLLMDAMVSNAATQAYFQSELGRGYKAGSVTGASLPFMVDMLTGVAAVSAGTKAASKGLMKWIAKNYTKSAIQKNIAKGVTGLTKGVVDSAIHTASFGMGRVANDYTQREIGNVQFDMDAQGNLQYDGREGAESGAGTAAKAAFSTGLETQSELIGEQFAPVLNFVGKQIMKLPGLKNIPASGFGKFMKDMYGSASVESVREFAKSAQFQGPIAEYAEEVYNNLGSVAIGDMTPEQLVDIDQNIDTFLGVAVMSAAFGLVGTGAFIREKYKTGKEIRDFERKMHEHIDFDRLKSDLQGQDIEGARDFVKQVMADKSLSLEEKKEEIKYIANVLKESAMSSAEKEIGKESLPTDEIEGNKATIYSEFETARKNIESALSPDIVGRIDAGEDINPIMLYSGLSEQQQDAIIDYQAARNDFEDYLSNVRNKIAEAKESARQEVEGVSNPDMGAVVRVNSNLSPYPIHIVGGTLAFDEDGFVDEGKSSETIFYIDENGKRKMAAPSAFVSLIDMNDTESVAGQAEADAEAQVVAEEQMQLPQQYVPVVGDEVTTQDGIRGTVTRFTPEGDAIVSDEEKDYVVPLNSIISQNETKNGTFSLDEENKLSEDEVQSKDEGLIPTVQEDPTSPVSNESASMEDKPVAVSPIPVDDKGNPMYHKAKIEDTISDLMDGSLDDNEIDEFVSANRKEAMDNLAKLEKKFPKMGTNKAKYLQDKAVHKSKMEEEQQRIAYWNSVEKEIKSLREKPGDAVAEEILSMEESVNGEELAAQALSNGNIRLLQSSFADETGFGKDEAKKYFGLFASSENGGMTIQEAGESLMQADRENGTNFFDQNDPNAGRDAIINVLSQARSRGDLANIIKNNRRDMAERERAAEYAAYEQWCQDNFHMTPKEYEAYEEMTVSLLLEKYKGVDINVLFNKINDNYNGRQEEGVAGSDAVLQGEGIIPSGRTGTGEDERGTVEAGVQGSGTDGTVQEGTPTGEIIDNVLNDAQNTLNSIAEERAKVNTSPTDAQKEAGNYKKGHIRLDGYDISIENPKGSERSGVDANGQKWSVSMNNDYGYIRGTKAVDGDHIDIFLSDFPEQGNVFVIDQLNEKGEFDESKVMYGFASLEDARAAYLSNYSPGWESRIGAITEVDKDEFKKWIDSSVRKTKAFSEYKNVNAVSLQENSDETEDNLSKNEPVAKDTKQKVDKKRTARINKARYELMDARRELSMAQSNPLYSQEERDIKQERFDKAKKAFHDLFDEVQDDIPVMTEEKYLDSKGYGFSGIGEVALHKGKQKTRKQQDKIVENQNQKDAEYVAKREELRKEYISKLNNGELRQPSTIEKLIKAANGNPDNEATQAARRSLKKRGINWGQNSDLRFREDRTLSEEESIIEKAKANGTYMKSPNGKPTNLNNKQWVQVRTKAFKEWFGDWENDPENSSKVMDKNGEPLVVFHGTLAKGLTKFDKEFVGSRYSYDDKGFFFISNNKVANDYASSEFDSKRKGEVIPVFINLKNPLIVDAKWCKKNGLGSRIFEDNDVIEFWDNYQTLMIEESWNKDGVIVTDGKDVMPVAFESNQIKSATDNIGAFDKANDDIRFREVDDQVVSFAQKYSLDEADVRKYAQSMKMKNLGGASYAFTSIKRDVRLLNLDLSLGEFVKVFSPIKKELYEKFGDVDSLRDEYVQLEMEQRNMMEAARKRAEEEAETEKKRLEEFELMSDEEMDAAYFKAMEENNESRMRDIINESARRNGYVSADEFRMAHRAPSYDEEGIDKNMVDIAANKDQIRESLNEQLRMNRDQYKDESAAAINKALSAIDKGGKPTVTIYRAVPKSLKEGKVRNGDWVSLSESYVKVHGEHTLNGNYRIMQEEVPAENLYWDGNDINEWGYDDRSDYRYKDTKNNRKLNDLVTRDDKGNIIPPSKRFNARKADPRFRIEDSVNQKFNEELSILTEENADKVTFNLGTPSDVLLSAGIANKPMKLYGNKVIKKMKKHGFNLSELENLPEAVANPIAVFDNLGREGNRSILTELKTDNGNFLVTIDLGESKDIDFNIVSSVFGKTDNKVVNWITKGYATYINKEKALDYLYYPAPIAETPKNQELSDITKIIENFENPTLEQGKIIAAVDEISESLHTPVRIVRDVNEITDKDSKAEQRKRKAKGWFDPETGEVVLVLPNASSVEDARETLFHEIVGHHGLRKMFGKDFDTFLDNVYDNADEGIQDAINRRGGDKRVATEEYLAELAERGFEDENERSLWQKIKDAFIDMLRKAGVNLGFKLSDNELRYILWRSHENLRQENVLDMAKDVAKQYELKVGNYRFREDIETEPDGSREAYNNSLMGNKYKFQEAYQDSMLALKNLQDVIAKVSGKPIEAFENAYMAENQMSSKSTAEAEKYYNEYFEPLEKEIAKLVTAGVTYDQISDYMILKHGIERNIEFSVRDTIRNVEKKQGIDAAKQMRQDYDHDKAQLRKDLENGVFKEDEYLPKLEEIGRKYVSNIKDYSATRTLLGKLTGKELPDGIDENKRTETYIQFFEDEYGKNADVQVLANTAIKEFESQFDAYTLWEKINAATRQPLKKSYNSGLMNKENYNHTNSMFRFYVPLRGWDETTAEDVYEYLVSETSPVNSVLKTAKGRKSIPDNPIPVIGNMAESTILQGNRNMMKQAFMSMVMNHPTDVATLKKAWYVIDPSSGEWTISYPSISEKDTMEEIETKMQEHEKRMKELEEEGKATQQSKGLNINYRIGNSQAKEHIVTVKRNGKDYMIFINGNPRAAQAINGLTNPDIEKNPMIKALGTANRWLAANFTTRNPAFVLSNLSRDLIFAQSAVMVKESPEYAGKFFVNVPKAMKSIMRNLNGKGNPNEEIDRLFNEFIENGGETGYMTLTDVDKYKKKIKQDLERLTGKEGSAKKALRWSVDRLEDFNRWAEDVSRFTTYVTSRQMGRTITESINDAKEITVNFNKKGAGYKTGGFWGISAGLMRNLYLFFNAGVQSLMNFQRLAKGNPTKFGIMLGGFTTAGFIIPALVNQFLIGMLGGGDDDPYQDLPDWIRRNNLCLYCGGGKFVTIPLPIELRAFYGLGDMAYQYTTTKGRVKLTEMMYDITNQITELLPLNPLGNNGDIVSTVMPDALKPFWQINQNKDFTGKPIYKKTAFNELDPEFKRVYKGTSGWLVDASQFLNEISGGSDFRKGIVDVNPAKIEHLFESYFGGMGKTFNQTGKTLWYGSKSLISGEKDENLKLRNTPVANRFMSETDEQSAYAGINREYFKIVDEFEEIEHEVNGLSQKAALMNPQYLKEYIELTHSAKFKKYGEFKKLKSKIDYAYALAKNVPDGELRKDIDKTILDLKRQVISIMDENGNSTTEKQ